MPYSSSTVREKADKEKLKKLRGKVANMQRELDIANRRPKGPPKPSYGGQARDSDWSKFSGEEKQTGKYDKSKS